MKIFKADMFRLSKDRIFQILLILTFFLPFASCMISNNLGGSKMTIEALVYQGLSTDILCVIIGITLSSFIGKEYQNNTIRNKICYGEGKLKVALIFLLETILIALSFIIVSTIGSLLFGVIFCDRSFSDDFFLKLLCQILILIAFSTCISSIVICFKSVKAGFIFTILVSVLLGAVAYIIPVNASKSGVMVVLSRILYMVVSNMLLKGSGGTYQVHDYTFEGVYLNCVLMSLSYIFIAISTCLLVVRKHNYK